MDSSGCIATLAVKDTTHGTAGFKAGDVAFWFINNNNGYIL